MEEEEQAQSSYAKATDDKPPKKTWSRKAKPKILGDDMKLLAEALLTAVRSAAPTKALDEQSKIDLDRDFRSQIERYHAEPHYWVTFHKMGDDDNVETVYIGAAGVGYTCRKGERVLLPQSALNCMKYAVREGLDHGRPVEINGRKYLRKVRQPMHSYTVEPEVVSPPEAAQWRARFEKQILEAQDLVPLDGGNAMDDLVEVGR